MDWKLVADGRRGWKKLPQRVGWNLLAGLFLLSLAGCGGEESPPKIASLSLPSPIAIGVDMVYDIVAEGTYKNGNTADVSKRVNWSSSNEAVAKVSLSGTLVTVSPGVTVITVSTKEGVSTTANVFVTDFPTVPQGGGNVHVILPDPALVDFGELTVDVPVDPLSIGITVLGSSFNYKLIDHGLLITSDGKTFPYYIKGPDGSPVPLSFNMIDYLDANGNQGQDGVEEPLGDNLLNFQAASLFFPNGGVAEPLTKGVYTFPIGAVDSKGNFAAETLQPIVYYKVPTAVQEELNLNILVVQGVDTPLQTLDKIKADAEIQGAIQTLRNVYETKVGLKLNVYLDMIPEPSFVTIDSYDEMDMLLWTFPLDAPSNAINMVVTGGFTLPDLKGVIGLAGGIPGPFNLDGTIVSGVLTEYQGDGRGHLLGFTMAHELGHYLGLWHTSQTTLNQDKIIGHDPIADTAECITGDLLTNPIHPQSSVDGCPDRYNIMFPIADDAVDPPISAQQIQTLLMNPAIAAP